MQIPTISSTAGPQQDGGFHGYIKESQLTAYLTKISLTTAMKCVRVDNTPTGDVFVDLSAAASNSGGPDIALFGAASDMTSADTVFISDTSTIKSLWFNIATAGVYTGDGIEIYDSTNGVSANRLLVTEADGTNGFRSTGWKQLSWTVPDAAGTPFALSPNSTNTLLSEPRRWYKIKLKNFGSATIAPVLSRIIALYPETGMKWQNILSTVNGSTSTAPVFSDIEFFPTNDDEVQVLFSNPATSLINYTYRRRQDFGPLEFTYLASDGTYKPLPNLVDGSDSLRNGPAVLTSPPTKSVISWSMPSDWAQANKTLTMSDGSTQTYKGYFIRMKPVNVNPVGEYALSVASRRAKQFGTDNVVGGPVLESQRLLGITVNRIGAISADTVIQVGNLSTGKFASVTIDDAADLPITYDFADVAFAAGEVPGALFVSGGIITDVDFDFVWAKA